MSEQKDDNLSGGVPAFWAVQKTGWSWLIGHVRRFRLSRRLSSLESDRDRLFAELGKKAIELGTSVDDPELSRRVEQLEEKRRHITEKIREKEEEINRIRCQFDSEVRNVDQQIDELEERREEQRQKLELNQISLDRAEDRRSSLQNRLTRAEQSSGDTGGTGTVSAPEGPSPEQDDEEAEPPDVDPDELEESISRTDRDLEELRNKRERLRDERRSIEEVLREKRKERIRIERKRHAELRRLESEIGDLERRLDDVDQEKTTFTRDLGRRLFEQDQGPPHLNKYVRRLERDQRRIDRTHDLLDDVQMRIEDVSVLELVRCVLPWLFLVLMVGVGVYLF